MKLFGLTLLTMAAFAANSVLTRMGVSVYDTDPVMFAVVRVAAGVVLLSTLVFWQRRSWPKGGVVQRGSGAASLALYMAGFSLAYLTLDAGVGALILFGGVQMTMFAGAVIGGERLGQARLVGSGVALVGLAVLVWPAGDVRLAPWGVAMMLVAAVGWGIYSLLGRSERDPLAGTAANFMLCFPLLLPLLWWADARWTAPGLLLAVVAGAVTSGLGYALWYRVVPALGAARAAVAQLSVPVIAAFAGAAVLDEALGWRFGLASVLVLGGIAMSQRR